MNQGFPYIGNGTAMEEDRSEKLEKKRDPGKTIEVLYQISEAVGSTRNLDDLYKVIHQSLNGIFDEDNFPIALDDEQKGLVTFPYPVEDKEDLMLLNTVFSVWTPEFIT